jgi:hypothetical protein
MFRIVAAALACAALGAIAADHLVSIPTRPGVKVGYWIMPRDNATATVVLLPGGEGGIAMKNGVPTSSNFLVRSRDLFAAEGFDVAVVGKPTDHADLDMGFRASAEHVEDLRHVIEKLKRDFGKPVWLVGTSRGTVSAAAAAIALDPSMLGGIVLTSSVTNDRKYAPVPALDLAKIRVPTLVMHHKLDQCHGCVPEQTGLIMSGLTQAPVKKLMLVDGGGTPYGPPCEPMHWHGYVGMEKEAVRMIADWIRDPKP